MMSRAFIEHLMYVQFRSCVKGVLGQKFIEIQIQTQLNIFGLRFWSVFFLSISFNQTTMKKLHCKYLQDLQDI